MFIASTNGDNTNIVMSQVVKERYGVEKVLCRVADPARAEWYETQGLHVICGTRIAISLFENEPPRGLGRSTRCSWSSPAAARSDSTRA